MMRFVRLKRTLFAAGIAVVLVGGTIGLAVAQQAPTPTNTPGQGQARPQAFLDALARQLGITTDRLQTAITAARTEVGLPANGEHRGPGGRPGFRPGMGPLGAGLQATADAIGISIDQLRQELPGKSIAQVAQAHGKNPADVAATLKNQAIQHIDQMVAAGRMTADRAAQMKQMLDQHLNDLMNRVLPDKLPGGPGGPGADGRGPGFGFPGRPGGAPGV